MLLKKRTDMLSLAVWPESPATQEAEVGGLQVQGSTELPNKFKANWAA